MKKIHGKFCALATAFLILLGCMPFSVMAESSDSYIELTNAVGSPGEEVTIDLNIQSVNNDCDSFSGYVDFDEGLEYVSAAPDGGTSVTAEDHGDYISIAGFSSSVIEGAAAHLTFKIPDNAAAGDVYIVSFDCDYFGADGESYEEYYLYGGSITVTEPEDPTEEPTGSAQGNYLGLSNAYGEPGETVSLKLYASSVNNDAQYCQTVISWDERLLFNSFSPNEGVNYVDNAGSDYLAFVAFTSTVLPEEIAEFSFTIPEDAYEGDTFVVFLECDDYCGADGHYDDYTVGNGIITVTGAQDPTEPIPAEENSIRFSDCSGAPGEEVTVNMNVSSYNNDCDSFSGYIDFDEALEYVSCISGGGSSVFVEDKGDCLSIAGFSSSNMEGTVAQLTFKIPEDASVGTVFPISFDCRSFGADGNSYDSYAVYYGEITVLEPTSTIATEPVTEPVVTETEVVTESRTTSTKTTGTGLTVTTKNNSATETVTSRSSDPLQTRVTTTVKNPAQSGTNSTGTRPVQSNTTPVVSETDSVETKTSLDIEQGGTAVITNVPEDVEFISKDQSVAVVDPDGTVHGKGSGSTIIYIIKDGNIINNVEINVTVSIYYGDVDLNNNINIFDAVAVAQYTVHKRTLSDKQYAAADVTKDDTVNIFDAVMIAKHTVGVKFPWE